MPESGILGVMMFGNLTVGLAEYRSKLVMETDSLVRYLNIAQIDNREKSDIVR